MVHNIEYYSSHPYLSYVASLYSITDISVLLAIILSDSASKLLVQGNVKSALLEEAKVIKSENIWCSMMEVFSLSSVINTPIMSLFPDDNKFEYRALFQGMIQPPSEGTIYIHHVHKERFPVPIQPIVILWSQCSYKGSHSIDDNEYLTLEKINHVTPVFRRVQALEKQCDEKNDQLLIAQVYIQYININDQSL